MIYRHGDVNLIRISKRKFKAMKKSGVPVPHKGKHVLARGEATGSVHELSCSDMELVENEGVLYLRIGANATLTHTSDHETLVVEPEYYVQVPEREVDHYQNSVVRKVVD